MVKEKLMYVKHGWKLARDYWFSEEKWQARGLLLVIIALNLGIVYIHVLLNKWRNTFYNVLNERNYDGFMQALGDFSLLAGAFILVAGYQVYLRMMLMIRWRKWLTANFLQAWLQRQTYYRMKLVDTNNTDNPDQRISEDVNLFVTHALTLSLGLLRESVTLVSFIIILWQMSDPLAVPIGDTVFIVGGYLVWAAIGYAGIGTWLTVKVGKPLVKLNFIQQRYEADFRFSLMRLRENTESVALYKGEGEEEKSFAKRFQAVFENYWKLMTVNKRLMWLTSGYSQISVIVGILVAAPRYFANKINLGDMFQIVHAYDTVQSSLSFFIDSFTQLAEWQAVINRLTQFAASMEQVEQLEQEQPVVNMRDESACTVKQLQLKRPDGYVLLDNFSAELQPGEAVLVSGPSGCGKSTLLRALAGIWPFGQGEIGLPARQKLLFLPQKSYLPLGTLRNALTYPGLPGQVEDAAFQQALAACCLPELVDKLDHSEDWAQILSLGEQQRLAFARIFLQQPTMVFLDEATTALDEPTEDILYRRLRDTLPQALVVSVGHRSTLQQYHDKKLVLDGQGQWNVYAL